MIKEPLSNDLKIDFTFRGLDTVQVPDIFFQTMLSETDIDHVLSDTGGLVPSQVILMSGNPGAGKTTLAVAVASKISERVHKVTQRKRPAALISLEMSDYQLAAQKKRLNAEFVKITTAFDYVETFRMLEEMNPSAVILDSIQAAAKGRGNTNKTTMHILNLFVEFARRTMIPCIIICHADKAGNYKGPSDLEHDCDTHIKVFYDVEMEIRTFWWVKNRFGGSPSEKMFGIEPERVWIGDPYGNRKDAKVEPVKTPGKDAYTAAELSYRWKELADTGEWKVSHLRSLITHTVDFLKGWETDPLLAGDKAKVHLSFEDNHVADCNGRSGKLRFGMKCWNPEGFALGKIGYGKEQPFIKKWCGSSHELLLWVVLHEWTHLYPGMQHHKLEFFRRVEKLAQDTKLFQSFGK